MQKVYCYDVLLAMSSMGLPYLLHERNDHSVVIHRLILECITTIKLNKKNYKTFVIKLKVIKNCNNSAIKALLPCGGGEKD